MFIGNENEVRLWLESVVPMKSSTFPVIETGAIIPE